MSGNSDKVLQPIENYDSKYLNCDEVEIGECDSNDEDQNYRETNKMSFQDLLNMHHKQKQSQSKQIVSGFKFGNEIQANTKLQKQKRSEEAFNTKTPDCTTHLDDAPSSSSTDTSRECVVEQKTPHARQRGASGRTSKRKSCSRQSDFVSPQKTRRAPLPLMNWADSNEVWLFMVYKEEASLNLRNPNLFVDYTNFMPRMRAILLDWVMEVCEVYHLRRVTYYLCVDYFDRFLSIRPDVPKNQLQLIGVTCLFLASKLEEVYPPRLSEFSFVCDGACSPEEILACELLILNSLGWDLNIMTPSEWLNLYMQIHFKANALTKQKLHADVNKEFVFPQYSGYQFTRASQLLDMCSLDPGFLLFSYSTVAAASMYFMYGKKAALMASGLTWKQLQPCVEYMSVFYHILKESPDPRLQSCKVDAASCDEASNQALEAIRCRVKDLVKDENHSLQSHVVNMEYFEKSAIVRLEQMGLKVERTYVRKSKERKKRHLSENKKSDKDKSLSDKSKKSSKERKLSNEEKNSSDEDKNLSDEENQAGEEDENAPMVCMYEVEKTAGDATLLAPLSDDEIHLDAAGILSDADLVTEENKSLLSFDEVLEGIVKCNHKNIPVQMSTTSEMLEEIDKLD